MKGIRSFIRQLKFYTLVFIGFLMYDQGVFAKISDFAHEFRPRTAIAPVSDFRGLDGARIDLFGLELQQKDFIDDDLFLLEFGRIMQESGYSTHGLAAYCSTKAGKRLFGGEEACLQATPDNIHDLRDEAREKQKLAFEAAGCHKKKGLKHTPWSREKRRDRCEKKVLKRLYSS